MDPQTFKAIDPLLDEIADIADKQLAIPQVHELLSQIATALGKGKVASLNVTVDVFDEVGMRSLPLLTTGLSAFAGKEPFRTWGDSALQRYVVEEGIRIVPHDRCPACWGQWDFKLQHPSCEHCGITMGAQCKLLLDNDECPWCNEGKVTAAEPRCAKCGHEVDARTVVWG